MLTLRTTSYYKIAQDITRFACNVIYLLNAVDEAADASVEVMTYFNMAASVATIVLAGMVAVMKNSVLMEVAANMADSQSDDAGHRRTGGGDDGAIELGTVEHYMSNPLHDGFTDPSMLFVRQPGTASVRSLIVQLLPDIDGPSLHAVDNAFKNDGVGTMHELKTYLEGGVIGIAELKRYANDGGLLMGDVMTLVTALKPFMPGGGEIATGAGSSSPFTLNGGSNDGDGGVDGSAVMSVLHGISEGLEELHVAVSSPFVLEADGPDGGPYTPTGDGGGGGGGDDGSGGEEGDTYRLNRRSSYGSSLRQLRMEMTPIPDQLRRVSMRRASARTVIKVGSGNISKSGGGGGGSDGDDGDGGGGNSGDSPLDSSRRGTTSYKSPSPLLSRRPSQQQQQQPPVNESPPPLLASRDETTSGAKDGDEHCPREGEGDKEEEEC
jgi:hypothetical protein